MAAFDSFTAYPWGGGDPWGGSAASTYQVTYNWGANANTTGQMPFYYPPAPEPVRGPVEMPESALEWLRRRVTEITDLAYAA